VNNQQRLVEAYFKKLIKASPNQSIKRDKTNKNNNKKIITRLIRKGNKVRTRGNIQDIISLLYHQKTRQSFSALANPVFACFFLDEKKMEQFRRLGIIDPVIRVIEQERFEEPTEIQEKAIPYVTAGKDVIAQSATGSGKTLAFGAGIIQHCEKGRGLQALVITPTRELAEQNTRALNIFSRYKPLSIISVYGGVSISNQIEALRTADVVVGTPGRILDHVDRGTINLHHIKVLVLDEADRMLDMGFIDDVHRIIKQCPDKRQTLLFSATMYEEITRLARRYMISPVKLVAESYVDPSKLKQVYYDVPDGRKFSLLVHLLKNERAGLVMVFCNTRINTDFVARNLKRCGIDATAIHGGFSQSKRNRTMDNFNNERVYVLVCTDVAARGLDIKGVSHVYNYDIPKNSKDYIHRIGRTARAGHEGKAVNILASRDHDNFRAVQSDRSLEITSEPLPEFERVPLDLRESGRGFRGGRGAPRRGARPGQSRFGQRRPGQGGFGQGRPGQARNGQSSSGQNRFGQNRPGQARPGSRPRYGQGQRQDHYGKRNLEHGSQQGQRN
jgi:superfamily II DNA/RNA helicase